MKCIIDNQIVLSQAPEGPLAAHIESFARSLREQGYALDSTHRQVLLATCFSRWLEQQEVSLHRISSIIYPSIYDTALGRCARAGAMRPRSGIYSTFCAVSTRSSRRRRGQRAR